MVNRNIAGIVIVWVVLLLAAPAVHPLETNITYVNDNLVKIRVVWSEEISESLADLYGATPGCAISGYSNENCASDENLLCEQNASDPRAFTYSPKQELADCDYTFRVIASDLVGNALIDYIYINFTLDSTSPTVVSGYPDYYITGNGVNAKEVRFEIRFDEPLLERPSVAYGDSGLNATFEEVVNGTYRYALLIENTKSEQVLSITASDLAGNLYNQNLTLSITAPRPPIINPGSGATIKSTFEQLTFFFYENISKDTITILLDGQDITTSLEGPDPGKPSAQYLTGRVYYYPLDKDILCNKIGNVYDCVNIPHLIEVSAIDSKGSKMGPVFSTFTVNDLTALDYPDVFRPLNINEDFLISDQPMTPVVVEWSNSSANFGESITVDVILPDSTAGELAKTVELAFPSLYYEFAPLNFSFGEGLNVLVLNAFDFNSFGEIVNFTYPFIMNAYPPNLTAITPPVKQGGKALKEVLEFSTSEQSRCRFDDDKSVLAPEDAFAFMTQMDSAQIGNGYFHYEALPASDSSIPLAYDYYVVCCDYFGLCSDYDEGHFNFTVDLYQPIITLIEPSSSINYYFELYVVTNELTWCKYAELANVTVPATDDSGYGDFFEDEMFDFDTDTPDPYMLEHYAVIDYKEKGPGTYTFYVECRDEAGNVARNRQTKPNIYIAKTKNITLSTDAPLLLVNLTLNGTTGDDSGLLSFTTNRVASCSFKFDLCSDGYYLFGDSSVGAVSAGVNGPYFFAQYLLGTDVTSPPETVCLPQYAAGEFPEGTYSYELYCTTEGKQESFGTLSDHTFPVVGFDGESWTFAGELSFTIDTTAPQGFTFTILNAKEQNGSTILYALDKVSVQLGLLENSSDAVSYYFGLSTDATPYTIDMQPNVVNWTATNATRIDFEGLSLEDLSTYFVQVIAIDAAGNRMRRSEFSQPLEVDLSLAPSCFDGILSKELGETDVDCGGSCIVQGNYCELGAACSRNGDCDSNNCGYRNGSLVRVCLEQADLCTNNLRDAGETGTDCGGSLCQPCSIGEICLEDSDCASSACEENICVEEKTSCNNDGFCDSEETKTSCPADCAVEATDTPDDLPDDFISGKSGSSIGLLEILLIVFAVIVLVGGGTFVVYTKYIAGSKAKTARQTSSSSPLSAQRPPTAPGHLFAVAPRVRVASKKYTKKRDLSIIDAFKDTSLSAKTVPSAKKEQGKEAKQPARVAKREKPTTVQESTPKRSKGKGASPAGLADDLSALDALVGQEDEISKLDALASREETDLDALAGKDEEDIFASLSALIGEDAAEKLDELEQTRTKKAKADLFDMLASMQSTDRARNKNIFERVLLYLIKSGKLRKTELSKVLLELSGNGIIEKKDIEKVLSNIEKEL